MLLLLFAIPVAIGLAGWNFYAVHDELTRVLPREFSEQELRVGIRYYIWTPLMSDAARRRYVWEHVWGLLAVLSISAVLWLSDHLIGASELEAAQGIVLALDNQVGGYEQRAVIFETSAAAVTMVGRTIAANAELGKILRGEKKK
jgi:hypothetical protein